MQAACFLSANESTAWKIKENAVPTPNTFKVPAKQWKRWSERAHWAFNEVYALGKLNQALFTHPKAKDSIQTHWDTVAWNFAWVAADAADGYTMEVGDEVHDIDSKTQQTTKTRRVKK
jgi:hypothetical protein